VRLGFFFAQIKRYKNIKKGGDKKLKFLQHLQSDNHKNEIMKHWVTQPENLCLGDLEGSPQVDRKAVGSIEDVVGVK